MTEQQTPTADEFDNLFDDSSEQDAGSNREELTLAELNSISGREFATKADALKHYQHLTSLVGDQKRIETEKKAKAAEAALSEKEALAKRIAELERKETVSEFLLANQGASKDDFELAEAYAEKKGLTLEEAWKTISGKFANVTKEDSDDEVGVKSKQRMTPLQSQNIAALREQASRGSSDAQEALIGEVLFKK